MLTEQLRRVRFYLTEADRGGGHPLDRALLDLLRAGGARGATVFRGVEGFGARRQLHTDRHVDVAPDLPVVVEWVDAAARVRGLGPRAAALARAALITVDDLGSAAQAGGAETAGDRAGDGGTAMEHGERARRVRIYLGRDDRADGRPAHLAILQLLRARGARGATVLGGIEGFGAGRQVHGDRLAELGRKLPLVVEWIDRPDVVERLLGEVRALVPAALVTVEDTTIVQGEWPE